MALARSNYICGRHFKENCSTVNCLTDECTSHHVSCPCCDCKIARLFAREQFHNDNPHLRESSLSRSCRLVYPDGHEEIIPIGTKRLSYDNISRWRACPPERTFKFNRILSKEQVMADRFEQIRKLCGYVEDGSSTAVTLGQDDATRGWAVRVGRITYHGDSLNEALDLATKDQST